MFLDSFPHPKLPLHTISPPTAPGTICPFLVVSIYVIYWESQVLNHFTFIPYSNSWPAKSSHGESSHGPEGKQVLTAAERFSTCVCVCVRERDLEI